MLFQTLLKKWRKIKIFRLWIFILCQKAFQFCVHLFPAAAPPECVWASLLEDWLLVLVEEVPWVEHVEKVELCVHWNGSLHPGLVGCRALLHRQLLQ